jgi:hypothetical protein
MDALYRQTELIRALLRPANHTEAMLQAISDFLSVSYVTCEHASGLLALFKESEARTALFVKTYARIVDWHNMLHVLQRFTQPEMEILGKRIGFPNMFNEVMAANYYELDLSHPEQRWVVQELVHLGAVEPGVNMVEVSLQVRLRLLRLLPSVRSPPRPEGRVARRGLSTNAHKPTMHTISIPCRG